MCIRDSYGDASTELPFGALGNGWVRRIEGRIIDTSGGVDRWADQTLVSYNAFGNPISTTEQGVSRYLSYDSLGLFPESETMFTSTPLQWNASWDRQQGKISTLTDPNGDSTRVDYDAVGRPTALSMNGGSAFLHYAYD